MGPSVLPYAKGKKKIPIFFFFLSLSLSPLQSQTKPETLSEEASVELGFIMGHDFWGVNLARPVYPSGVHPDSRQDGRGLASRSQPHQVVLHV